MDIFIYVYTHTVHPHRHISLPSLRVEQSCLVGLAKRAAVPIASTALQNADAGRKGDTVDGQNPAPSRMMMIPLFIGFQPSQVVQDFFHQQYF